MVQIKENEKPYFLWDDNITWAELKSIINNKKNPNFSYYFSKILREASFKDIWSIISIGDFKVHFPIVRRFLGRKTDFWEFIYNGWVRLGLL